MEREDREGRGWMRKNERGRGRMRGERGGDGNEKEQGWANDYVMWWQLRTIERDDGKERKLIKLIVATHTHTHTPNTHTKHTHTKHTHHTHTYTT